MLTSVLMSLLFIGQVPSLLPDPSPSASVPVPSSDAPVRPTSFLFQDPPSVPAPDPEPAPKRVEVPSDGSPATVPVEIGAAPGPAPIARPPAAAARSTVFVPVKQWVAATNRPGWEGYCRLENGAMLDIEQWRYVGLPALPAIPIPDSTIAPLPVLIQYQAEWATQNVLGGGGSACGPGGCSGRAIGFPMFRRFGR